MNKVIKSRNGHNITELLDINIPFRCVYDWDYSAVDGKTERLYKLAKQNSWDEDVDINWNLPSFPKTENLPENFICEWSNYSYFAEMESKDKLSYLSDYLAWGLSQVLHGEQGAFLVSSQLVLQAPTFSAKKYAASQTIDEAKHVLVFNRYIERQFRNRHDITHSLRKLLDKILMSEEWDLKFIGMQLVIENLALANFNEIKKYINDPLLRNILSYVIADESRHISFGIDYLKRLVSNLSKKEISLREDFAFEACCLAYENTKPYELWNKYNWPITFSKSHFETTKYYRSFKKNMSSRILPHLDRIGLLSERAMKKYRDFGLAD